MSAPVTGLLRRRVTLEAPQDTPDAIGGVARAYVAFASVWAEIESLRGATQREGGRLEQALQWRVTIRWREDVDGETRIGWGSRKLLVRAARDPDASRRALVLDCEETTP